MKGMLSVVVLALVVTGLGSVGAASASATPSARHPVAVAKGPYLAESQNIKLARYYRPSCRSGCMLSGDSTAALYNMTWSSWGRVAAGKGSYHLDGCEPNCAMGKIYKVPVIVKLENLVRACYRGREYFYTRAVFTFPKGLPKALRGANAPLNPWTFTPVIDEARQSCRG